MPGMAQPAIVLPEIAMLRWAPAGATLPLPPEASTQIGTGPQFRMELPVMVRSLLLPASSHQYSGDTRIADIQQPSSRLPVISPWLALMRRPRERLKPKLQLRTTKLFPTRRAEHRMPPRVMATSRSSVTVGL